MKRFCFILISLVHFSELNAQLNLDSVNQKVLSSKFEISVDYVQHTRYNNPINTINLHGLIWKKRFFKNYLFASVGLTATYAWGYSEQVANTDTSSVIYIYKTTGYGLGPILQIEHTIINLKRFSIVGEASGGIIVYTNRFPYGGDYYNFMFRIGPSICYRVCKNGYFKVGYRWMHVSNGKGYGNQNPFYEAQGVGLGLIKMF